MELEARQLPSTGLCTPPLCACPQLQISCQATPNTAEQHDEEKCTCVPAVVQPYMSWKHLLGYTCVQGSFCCT